MLGRTALRPTAYTHANKGCQETDDMDYHLNHLRGYIVKQLPNELQIAWHCLDEGK